MQSCANVLEGATVSAAKTNGMSGAVQELLFIYAVQCQRKGLEGVDARSPTPAVWMERVQVRTAGDAPVSNTCARPSHHPSSAFCVTLRAPVWVIRAELCTQGLQQVTERRQVRLPAPQCPVEPGGVNDGTITGPAIGPRSTPPVS
jgi:hypothetical protein